MNKLMNTSAYSCCLLLPPQSVFAAESVSCFSWYIPKARSDRHSTRRLHHDLIQTRLQDTDTYREIYFLLNLQVDKLLVSDRLRGQKMAGQFSFGKAEKHVVNVIRASIHACLSSCQRRTALLFINHVQLRSLDSNDQLSSRRQDHGLVCEITYMQ